MMAAGDSAGIPWEGRSFGNDAPSNDDGSAPERLIEALRRFRTRELGEADVVDAVRESRLLVPLVAVAGETGTAETGLRIDKTQELSIVTVEAPDGRRVLPAFTSVQSMAQWNPVARPVPADGVRVALAAADEGTDLVIIDPTSSTEFVIRRPALWAIAQSATWLPSYLDPEILDEFMESAEREDAIVAVQLAPGDPDSRMAGAELVVHLSLVGGLDRAELDRLLNRLQERWSHSEIVAARVDSLEIQVANA